MLFIKLVFDFENFYNFIYLVITIISLNIDIIYCVLLVDCVYRFEDLKIMILSFKMNYS
jgi:hypothetical protein